MAGRAAIVFLFGVRALDAGAGTQDADGGAHGSAWWPASQLRSLRFASVEERGWILGVLHGTPGSGKLVRDGVPQAMAASGTPGLFRVAEPAELPHLLLSKVREEAEEVIASGGSAEEIADLLVVLEALARRRGLDGGALSTAAAEKHRRAGGFERGWVLRMGGPDG